MPEHFLILCREPGKATRNLGDSLSGLGRVEVVSDISSEGAVWYPDSDMEGFGHLSGWSPSCPCITAWARAWKHLELDIDKDYSGIWMVEEDVAGSRSAFSRLVDITLKTDADFSAFDFKSRDQDSGWPHWAHGDGYFAQPFNSFVPLCRFSRALVEAILDFRNSKGRFIFMEILFASIVAEQGFSYFDWAANRETSLLLKSFRYRPEVNLKAEGICHPVKDPMIHEAICSSPVPDTKSGAWHEEEFED